MKKVHATMFMFTMFTTPHLKTENVFEKYTLDLDKLSVYRTSL